MTDSTKTEEPITPGPLPEGADADYPGWRFLKWQDSLDRGRGLWQEYRKHLVAACRDRDTVLKALEARVEEAYREGWGDGLETMDRGLSAGERIRVKAAQDARVANARAEQAERERDTASEELREVEVVLRGSVGDEWPQGDSLLVAAARLGGALDTAREEVARLTADAARGVFARIGVEGEEQFDLCVSAFAGGADPNDDGSGFPAHIDVSCDEGGEEDAVRRYVTAEEVARLRGEVAGLVYLLKCLSRDVYEAHDESCATTRGGECSCYFAAALSDTAATAEAHNAAMREQGRQSVYAERTAAGCICAGCKEPAVLLMPFCEAGPGGHEMFDVNKAREQGRRAGLLEASEAALRASEARVESAYRDGWEDSERAECFDRVEDYLTAYLAALSSEEGG